MTKTERIDSEDLCRHAKFIQGVPRGTLAIQGDERSDQGTFFNEERSPKNKI